MAQVSERVRAALDKQGLPVSVFEAAVKERNWTEARVAVLEALILGEFSHTDAAAALGKTSRAAVHRKAKRQGVSSGLTRAEAAAQAEKTRRLKRDKMRAYRAKAEGQSSIQPVRSFAPSRLETPPARVFAPKPLRDLENYIPGPAGGLALEALGNTDCRFPLPGPSDRDPHAQRFFCAAPDARPFGSQFPYCARCIDAIGATESAKAADRAKAGAGTHTRGKNPTVFGSGQSGWGLH